MTPRRGLLHVSPNRSSLDRSIRFDCEGLAPAIRQETRAILRAGLDATGGGD